MCGICGFTCCDGGERDHATLAAMCDAMAHRGPDGEGRYLADGIALGHRRLALIDLEGGGQPMVRDSSAPRCDVWTTAIAFDHVRGESAQVVGAGNAPQGDAMRRGRWAIVFNGEIYNYRELREELRAEGYEFATESDTEVLLVGYIAWSEALLDRVRGMFAFAIHDAQTRELFCARDFFGIKPFYYTVQNGQFIFASEIKGILQHPAYRRELNEQALAQYLCFQFSPLRETFFKGVFKLSPGHYMRVGADGSCKIERYWKPRYLPDDSRSEPEAVDMTQQAMRESVRYHNIADVEVGSFLSSGIDSSYLTALLARENPDIKTFTVGFSEYKAEYDEVSWARELADMLGIENDSKHITEDEFWQVLPLVQWHMDEPSADPSAVALYFVDQIAAKRVKAVLSGEGADEFFGGYRVYQAPLAAERLSMLPKPLLHAGSIALRSLGQRGANYLDRASERVEDWYYTNANGVAFSPEQRDAVLSQQVRERLAGHRDHGALEDAIGLGAFFLDPAKDAKGECDTGMPSPQQLTSPVYSEVAGLDEVRKMQHVDLWFWLVGDILLKTDKMSMAHSLESRVPFLDRKVFELASTLPLSGRVTPHQTKVVLRKAAERAIPESWAQKEKLGFPVPLSGWLRDERRFAQVRERFASESAARFFDVAELMQLLEDHKAEKADNTRKIWIVYSFLVWYRVFFEAR